MDSLIEPKNTVWQRIQVRHTYRCYLCDTEAWTVYEGKAVPSFIVMRQESDGSFRYAFSNAQVDTELPQLAWWKCQRYFIERANFEPNLNWVGMNCKLKNTGRCNIIWPYLTVTANWFITQTKYQYVLLEAE